MKIPEQYLPVMPYLIVTNAKGFVDFAKSVFGATEQLIVPAENNKIMHGEIRISDAVIMFGDANDSWKEKAAAMFLYVKDVKRIYNLAMDHGAKSLEKPQKKDYGFSAGFEDPFGNHWFIVQPENKIQ